MSRRFKRATFISGVMASFGIGFGGAAIANAPTMFAGFGGAFLLWLWLGED